MVSQKSTTPDITTLPDLQSITDVGTRKCVIQLLNLVQVQANELITLREENKNLRDEIARLKGEQGRPKFSKKSNIDESKKSNVSSEKERDEPKKRNNSNKVIHINRIEKLKVDRNILPKDAEFKGHTELTTQDIVFETNNVLFLREKFYSPSEKETYLAPLPPGYDGGEFGPSLIAFVLSEYHIARTSEPRILELLRIRGIIMSAAQLSNILTKDNESFHEEKAEVHEAGLTSTPWQQTDDTSTRINGILHHCHILCNPFFTIYNTLPNKDRLSVLDLLRMGAERKFLYNIEAHFLAEEFGVSKGILDQIDELSYVKTYDEQTFVKKVKKLAPAISDRQLTLVMQAAAIAEYHNQDSIPIVQSLISDDAKQFGMLAEEHSLCWIHEGRHYKKLIPILKPFQEETDAFLDKFWDYYRDLREYRQAPTKYKAKRLERRFDKLFSTVTSYDELNARIVRTKEKKDKLLLVLSHPEIPLHNNDAELAARERVRKRDVSFGPRTVDGAKNWDTFQSLLATARKLGVNAYEYIEDRVKGSRLVPRLADLIKQKAAACNLGQSWVLPEPGC